jgi:predicted RNA-binding protein YlxR (DUF448 family)
MASTDSIAQPLKRCSTCRQHLPPTDFWRLARASDGRQGRCITCCKKSKAATRAAYLDRYRAADRAAHNAAYAAEPERHRAKSRAFAAANYDKYRASIRQSIAKKPEKYAAIQRTNGRKYLLRDWGLTAAEFDALLARQGGACAICQDPLRPGRSTHIDHDHATYAIRGLLCGTCNRGIGSLRDSVELLERAIAYLRRAPLLGTRTPAPRVLRGR